MVYIKFYKKKDDIQQIKVQKTFPRNLSCFFSFNFEKKRVLEIEKKATFLIFVDQKFFNSVKLSKNATELRNWQDRTILGFTSIVLGRSTRNNQKTSHVPCSAFRLFLMHYFQRISAGTALVPKIDRCQMSTLRWQDGLG